MRERNHAAERAPEQVQDIAIDKLAWAQAPLQHYSAGADTLDLFL